MQGTKLTVLLLLFEADTLIYSSVDPLELARTEHQSYKIREASSEITMTDETPLIQGENDDLEATQWDT